MTSKPTSILFLLLCSFLFSFSGCKSNEPELTIPYVMVYEEINLNSLSYQNLKQQNGYIYLDQLGYRGIVVIRDEDSQSYKAYDRACPYHPDEECALISAHSSGFFLEDDCCGSYFDPQTGWPTSGPATSPARPLRPYQTFVNSSNYLVISSQ